MLAFSLWDSLWVVFASFLLVSVLIALFSVVSDLFRDHEVNGAIKAMWLLAILFFPLIGLIVYVIVRGKGMAERSAQQQKSAKESFDNYVRDVGGGAATEIEKAKALLDNGTIDAAEFSAVKSKILA